MASTTPKFAPASCVFAFCLAFQLIASAQTPLIASGRPNLFPAPAANQSLPIGLYTRPTGQPNILLASLKPGLIWQRVRPADGSVGGPVLYQLLFSTAGTPGTLAKFDTNPRHLTNSLISESGGFITFGGIVNFHANQPFPGYLPLGGGTMTGNINFASGQTFPITGTNGGTVTSITAGPGLLGGTITASGTFSLDTGFTNARYLQLAGGNMTGLINFASGQTFPGTASGNFLPLTGGTLTGALTGTTGAFSSATNTLTSFTSSTTGTGLFSRATATTGTASGVFGGVASSSAATADTRGVVGTANSPFQAIGVLGTTTATTPSVSPNVLAGVFGQSGSPNGYGVFVWHFNLQLAQSQGPVFTANPTASPAFPASSTTPPRIPPPHPTTCATATMLVSSWLRKPTEKRNSLWMAVATSL